MSDTRRHADDAALAKVGLCKTGECNHTRRVEHKRVRDVQKCHHFASAKSLTRDRDPFKTGHRFSHDMRNTRTNLLDKVRALQLNEALGEDRAPRKRRNHRQSYVLGKDWARMVKHGDSVAWADSAIQLLRCCAHCPKG